jgi:hypothetical protein
MRTRENFNLLHFSTSVFLGFLAPSLYALELLIQSPYNFFFNNFAFHLLLGGEVSFGDILLDKLVVLGKLLIQPHYLLVFVAAIFSQVLLASSRHSRSYNPFQKMIVQMSLTIGVGLMVVYLIPYPIKTPSFQQPLVFFILASLPAFKYILDRGKKTVNLMIALYLLTFLYYPADYIADVRKRHSNFGIDHVRRVSMNIREHSEQSDTILSRWVGYNIFAQRPQVNSEDFTSFQYDFGNAMIPHGRYKLMTEDRISRILKERRAELVVANNNLKSQWSEELDSNYNLIDSVDGTYIYKRGE